MVATHCNRRGAAPRAPMAAHIGSLNAPENCPHFAAPRARVRALRAARQRMARPCRVSPWRLVEGLISGHSIGGTGGRPIGSAHVLATGRARRDPAGAKPAPDCVRLCPQSDDVARPCLGYGCYVHDAA